MVYDVAAKIAKVFEGEVLFINLGLTNAYNQLTLDNATSHRTQRFLTGFYGLGDMPNEFQRVMDSTIGTIPFTTCYIDDILIVFKGFLKEQTDIVNRVLSNLDNQNFAQLKGSNVNSFRKKSTG